MDAEVRAPEDTSDLEQRWAALRMALTRVMDEAEAIAPRASQALMQARELSRLREPANSRAEELRQRLQKLQDEVDGLRTAMDSRAVIEQAKGMVMLRDRCDADTAFHTLVKASQTSHRKLRDVALQVVAWGMSGQDRIA